MCFPKTTPPLGSLCVPAFLDPGQRRRPRSRANYRSERGEAIKTRALGPPESQNYRDPFFLKAEIRGMILGDDRLDRKSSRVGAEGGSRAPPTTRARSHGEKKKS